LAYLGDLPAANTAVTEQTRQTTKSFPPLSGDHFAGSEKDKEPAPGLLPGRR
jgi:hypothetical protein